MNNYSRSVSAFMIDSAPEDTEYVYIGPADERTREFCLQLMAAGDLTSDDIMINALDMDKLPSYIQEKINGLNLQEINSNEEVLGDSLSLFRELQTEEFIRQQFKLAKIFSEQAIDNDPLGLKK